MPHSSTLSHAPQFFSRTPPRNLVERSFNYSRRTSEENGWLQTETWVDGQGSMRRVDPKDSCLWISYQAVRSPWTIDPKPRHLKLGQALPDTTAMATLVAPVTYWSPKDTSPEGSAAVGESDSWRAECQLWPGTWLGVIAKAKVNRKMEMGAAENVVLSFSGRSADTSNRGCMKRCH